MGYWTDSNYQINFHDSNGCAINYNVVLRYYSNTFDRYYIFYKIVNKKPIDNHVYAQSEYCDENDNIYFNNVVDEEELNYLKKVFQAYYIDGKIKPSIRKPLNATFDINIIFTYYSKKYDKTYVVYTGALDKDVCISIIDEYDDGTFELSEIEDDDEYNTINKIFQDREIEKIIEENM